MGVNIGWVRVSGGCPRKEEQTGQDWKYKRFNFHGIENSVNEGLTASTPLPGSRDVALDY
ncbi:MAG TPA: hypothetical protein VFI68_11620 [Anaerolineales bacterium]|nr:hypothetical protein [Anaerolineales bacterium]